jgi:glycosyltransferase involved in cell wall biosynthesis
VRILRNRVNAGPYVSKNIALTQARGAWITGHDADDWAHPQRIERHLVQTLAVEADASLIYWIRMRPDGQFLQIRPISPGSFDGVARVAAIACMFRANMLRARLGFWDSVRFGADSEMLDRAETVLGARFHTFRQFGLIGLDSDTSLTNDPVHGTRDGGVSPTRTRYLESYGDWHVRDLRPETAFLPLLQHVRRFDAPPEMVVPVEDVAANLPQGGPR